MIRTDGERESQGTLSYLHDLMIMMMIIIYLLYKKNYKRFWEFDAEKIINNF